MGYRNFQPAIQPTALQDPYGQAWMRAQGIVKDYLLDLARHATQLRFPSFASPDALGAIGSERLIDKGTSPQLGTPETDAAYAVRLKNAWSIWSLAGTAWGLLTAFKAQGYAPTLVQQNGLQFTLDGGGNVVITVGAPLAVPIWNMFEVWFPTVPSSWTDIHNPPTLTSAPSITELRRLRRIINLWKPAHMFCIGIGVLVSGHIWGEPNLLWGEMGAEWGPADVVYFPATDVLVWGYPPQQAWGQAGLTWGGAT